MAMLIQEILFPQNSGNAKNLTPLVVNILFVGDDVTVWG
jgi:hypothetical protein